MATLAAEARAGRFKQGQRGAAQKGRAGAALAVDVGQDAVAELAEERLLVGLVALDVERRLRRVDAAPRRLLVDHALERVCRREADVDPAELELGSKRGEGSSNHGPIRGGKGRGTHPED